jgi:D-proline reductase (dithiol) PrdB
LITTAAPYQPGKGDQGPGAPYNAAAKFYNVYSEDSSSDHDLRISHPFGTLGFLPSRIF